MGPIRVLYVINSLGGGGAEHSLAEMLQPLAERGIEITIACLYDRDEGVRPDVLAAGHDVVLIGPSLAIGLLRLRKLISVKAPHVIHTTIFESDILGRLASVGRSVPVVTSIVNPSYAVSRSQNPDLPLLKLEIARAIDGLTARHLNSRFHALTQSVAEAAVEALRIDPERIEVIPRGRSRQRLGEPSPERRQSVRHALGIAESTIVLLSVGRQEYQKGQVNALRALASLQAENPDLLLLLAGREGMASKILKAVVDELDLGDRVRFLGHRDDVPDLMVAADLLVFPSLYEGMGGTILEAMALELPVVASDLPAVREIAADTVVYVSPDSASDLVRGVERVLHDQEQARMLSKVGRDRFEANFNIDQVAARMADFYRTTLNR